MSLWSILCPRTQDRPSPPMSPLRCAPQSLPAARSSSSARSTRRTSSVWPRQRAHRPSCPRARMSRRSSRPSTWPSAVVLASRHRLRLIIRHPGASWRSCTWLPGVDRARRSAACLAFPYAPSTPTCHGCSRGSASQVGPSSSSSRSSVAGSLRRSPRLLEQARRSRSISVTTPTAAPRVPRRAPGVRHQRPSPPPRSSAPRSRGTRWRPRSAGQPRLPG